MIKPSKEIVDYSADILKAFPDLSALTDDINKVIHDAKLNNYYAMNKALITNKNKIIEKACNMQAHLSTVLLELEKGELPFLMGELEQTLFDKFCEGEGYWDWAGCQIAQQHLRSIRDAIEEAIINIEENIPFKWEKHEPKSAATGVVKMLAMHDMEITGYEQGLACKLLTFILNLAGIFLDGSTVRKAITKINNHRLTEFDFYK